MPEFYVKNNKVEYKLSNGKTLTDSYNKEKDKELKEHLDDIEETINFEKNYKSYDFSFINFANINTSSEKYKLQIINTIKKCLEKNSKIAQLTLGINNESKYKDNWFVYDEKNKNEIIKGIDFKPYCARIDYVKSENNIYLQYMLDKNGKVEKEKFKLNENITDDSVLNEYLK